MRLASRRDRRPARPDRCPAARLRARGGGLFEPLEQRVHLSTITWDGGPTGMGTDLLDPVNWAGDVLPGPNDVAAIETPGPDITLASGGALDVGSLRLGLDEGRRSIAIIGTLRIVDPEGQAAIGLRSTLVVGGLLESVVRIETYTAVDRTIRGHLDIAGGTVQSTQAVENDGFLTVRGGTLRTDVNNRQDAFIYSGAIGTDKTFFGLGGSITTLLGGGSLSGPGTLRNESTLEYAGGATETFTVNARLENSEGSVSVESGTLALTGPGSFNTAGGRMLASAGATLRLGVNSGAAEPFGHDPNSVLLADGLIELVGNHSIFAQGLFTPARWVGDGAIALTGAGEKQFHTDMTIDVARLRLEMASGAVGLTGPGIVTVTKTLEWASGAGPIAGEVIVDAAGKLAITGSSHQLSGRLVNRSLGSVWTVGPLGGSTITFDNGVLENAGRLLVDILGFSSATTNGFTGGVNTLVNTGEIIVQSVSSAILDTATTLTWDNRGTVRALSGGVEIRGTVVQKSGFTLTGGVWEAHGPAFVDFPGSVNTIAAGARVIGRTRAPLGDILSATSLTIGSGGALELYDNDRSQSSTLRIVGDLMLAMGSMASGQQVQIESGSIVTILIDDPGDPARLTASGAVSINGGTLVVELPSGVMLGDSFTILTGGSRSGEFASVQLPDLSALGLEAVIEYTTNGVIVRVRQGSAPAIVTWTGAGDASSWSDPANWDRGALPAPGQTVMIPDVAATIEVVYTGSGPAADIFSLDSDEPLRLAGGTFTISGDGQSTISTLTLEGTIFATSEDLIVLQTFDIRGGAVRGPGDVIVPGLVVIEGGTTILDDTQWRLEGGVEWRDGQLVSRNTTITLVAGTQLNSTGPADRSLTAESGANQFIVGGDFQHSGAGAMTFTQATGASLEVNIASGGSVDVQGGQLFVDAGGASSGDYTLAAGASIRYLRDYRHAAGSSIAGDGAFIFDSGVHSIEGGISISDSVTIGKTAVVQIRTDQTIDAAVLIIGELSSDGVLTLTSDVELQSGATLSGAGSVTLGLTARTDIQSGVHKAPANLRVDVLNLGEVRWIDTDVVQDGGVWRDASLARFFALADARWTGLNSASHIVSDGATMTIDTAGTATFAGDHTLVLRGRIETINGQFVLTNIIMDGAVVQGGMFDVSGTLTIEGDTTTFNMTEWRIVSLAITNVDVQGRDAILTITAGTITNTTLQPMEFRGAGGANQFIVEGSLTKTGAGAMLFVDAGAPVPVTIAPGASVDVQQGSLGWLSSAAIDGDVTIRDLAALQLGGAVQAFITAQLFLEGRLEVLDGVTNLPVGSLTGGGVLAIAPDARVELQSDASAPPLLAAAEVAGDLAISGPVTLGGSTTVAPGGRLTAEGIVLAVTAAMRIEELGQMQAGDFRADGRLDINGAADLNSLLVGGSVIITGGALTVREDIIIEPSDSLTATDDATVRADSLRNDGGLELNRGADLQIERSIVTSGDMTIEDSRVAVPALTSTGQSRLLLDSARSFVTGRFELLDQSQAIASRSSFVVSGDYTQGAGATLVLEIGAEERPDARLTVGGQAQLAGTLIARYIDGYAPVEGTRLRIIEADSIVGGFDTVTLPVAPAGDKSVLVEGPSFLEILSTDLADMNGDGALDFFDFLMFQDLFAVGDPLADLDGDGVLDFFDFLTFQSFFADG